MKAKYFSICIVISLFGASLWAADLKALTPAEAVKGISWYGQAGLRIELGGKLVWIDPVGVTVKEKADLILVTHGHDDHFDKATIDSLTGPSTVVLVGFDTSIKEYQRMKPGDTRTFGDLTVEAVPAYNIEKAGHPKGSLFCGFVLSAQGVRVYDAGDTERIPEMKSIKADIAFLPLGQIYTMNSVAEAEQAALDVKASIAIPIHYGLYEGTEADADKFVADLAAKGLQSFKMKRN
jgi:L-ascorbate metabolism protein UlaG (beta-lactamase superfamily)